MAENFNSRIRRFFRVYEGETSKVLLFGLLGAVLQCGIAVGVSAADALFLIHQGANELPYVYLFSPIVIVTCIAFHALLISRLGIEKVLDLTLVVLAISIVCISLFLNSVPEGQSSSSTVYYAVKLTTMVAYVALYTLFWNVTDSYFTILDAKRLFAYLSAGCALGAAAGGALVHSLSSVVRVEQLFLVWAGLALLSLPVALSIRKQWKKLDVERNIAEKRTLTQEVRYLASTYRKSSFAIFITASLFLTLFVSLICEYQYYGVLASNRSESELASLLGQLNCAVSLFNLFVNLFLFNRLVEWVGVRNLVLFQSLSYVAVFCLLVVDHTEMAAILGFFVYHGLFISIDGNNFNLLLNALPNHERKQLRTFIEGACEPLAHAFVGGGLVLAAASLSPAQISVIGLVSSVACFIIGLFLRNSYLTAMVDNLRACWLDFSNTKVLSSNEASINSLVSDDIGNLLEQAPLCTPLERRALEQQITVLGVRAVPGCVRALNDEHLPLKSRSLAARVLSKISFSQLESMTDQIVNRTLVLAYDTFLWEQSINTIPLSKEMKLLGLRMSQDKRANHIDFMLEILTLSGKLASFEPLAASLRSKDSKSRGTAIESIEQACSRKIRRLLRPLLDERESDKRLPLALSLTNNPELTSLERVLTASNSLEDLEAAIGLRILADLNPKLAHKQAQMKSNGTSKVLSHSIANAVLLRSQGKEAVTLIDRASALLLYPSTKDLGIGTLLALAEAAFDDHSSGTSRNVRVLNVSISGVSLSKTHEPSTTGDPSDRTSRVAKFDLDQLIARCRKDSSLAWNLYNLIRSTDDGQIALA